MSLKPFESFWDLAARHKLNLDESWFAARLSGQDDDTTLCEMKPARPKTRGKNKGQQAWGKEKKTCSLTRKDYEDAAARYSERTGNCSECTGSGRVMRSWHHIDGTAYGPCTKCNATGRKHA